jgi:hypothetical protein
VLKDHPENRTIQQNKYLHLVFSSIGQEWGECMENVKEYLKKLYLKEYMTVQ